MYDPPKFLTPEVLAAVLAEFPWLLPAPYTLKADFDGIEVRLPRCHLYVTEGFESDMDLAFLPDKADQILSARRYGRRNSARRGRRDPACHENEVRDLCTLLFTYFQSSLGGDFEWVSAYQAHGAELG